MKHEQRVIVVMIVKNEAKTIERTLSTVMPWVHGAIICDTGSTDGTQQIVAEAVGSAGERFDIGFGDYSQARNRALSLAKEVYGLDRNTWYLMLDADSVLLPVWQEFASHNGWGLSDEIRVQTTWRPIGTDYTSGKLRVRCGNLEFWRRCLFRADSVWYYEGAVHEVPVGEPEERAAIVIGSPGKPAIDYLGTDRSNKLAQWQKHEQIFLAIKRALTPREQFYYAQTLELIARETEDPGKLEQALSAYSTRAYSNCTGGWYLETGYAAFKVAEIAHELGLDPRLAHVSAAIRHEPGRAEYWLLRASILACRNDWIAAFSCAYTAAKLPIPDDGLFVDVSVYGPTGTAMVFAQQYERQLGIKEIG